MDDGFDLQRFLGAQGRDYETAFAEISAGAKRSHWIWYILPQVAGLGRSPTARLYSIRSIDEAKAYLEHPVLGQRLRTCIEVLLKLNKSTAEGMFSQLDAMKLRSSLTLFIEAGGGALFKELLNRWFAGSPDQATLEIIRGDVGL